MLAGEQKESAADKRVTYLVSITPGEVLSPDVLVRVLDALLERGHVRPMLPMLVPEVVGVEAGEDDGGGDTAVFGFVVSGVVLPYFSISILAG